MIIKSRGEEFVIKWTEANTVQAAYTVQREYNISNLLILQFPTGDEIEIHDDKLENLRGLKIKRHGRSIGADMDPQLALEEKYVALVSPDMKIHGKRNSMMQHSTLLFSTIIYIIEEVKKGNYQVIE